METELITTILSGGPSLILGTVCYVLWKRNLMLQSEKDEVYQKLVDILKEKSV